jgi:hypothetical protein
MFQTKAQRLVNTAKLVANATQKTKPVIQHHVLGAHPNYDTA